MAHLIDREAPDPVCPIIGRTDWFRNDSLVSKIIPQKGILRKRSRISKVGNVVHSWHEAKKAR